MQRFLSVALAVSFALSVSGADEPVTRGWRINPSAASATPELRAVLPDVHAVRVAGGEVVVESSGLSLQSLGAPEANDREPVNGARRFEFHLPLHPKPAAPPTQVPADVIAVLRNGVPVYNPASALSWGDQNLWHPDAVAASVRVSAPTPLLASLLSATDRHSPLIGYALDGYPIYGPYGWDERGQVRRFRSGYQLRKITRRDTLPGGKKLTVAQEGPAIDSPYPLGTFAEDYEYVDGSGDLDEHNGRFTKTPEYPDGTYAYFLATDDAGRMAFPYLIGRTYLGTYGFDLAGYSERGASEGMRLLSKGNTLVFVSTHEALEKVHERELHLIVVSDDLATFEHVHPEPLGNGVYRLDYRFPHGGHFRLYADHTPAGGTQTIARFEVTAEGPAQPRQPLTVSTSNPIPMRINGPQTTGADIRFTFDVSSIDGLEPYLGAWAHIMIISEDGSEFIHAHPLEDTTFGSSDPWKHTHTAGPAPAVIETITGFRKPGLYKIWLQVQRSGEVLTFPYVIRIAEGHGALASEPAPHGTIAITVSSAGYTPSRIEIQAGNPVTLAFTRKDAQNCASEVRFPELGIAKALPVGERVLVKLDAPQAGELHFACGMGMYRGSLVVR